MKKLIFSIGIRSLLFICALEFFLSFGGLVFIAFRNAQNALLSKKGDYKIMCYGESITVYGNESSYPRYLEAILNDEPGRRTFQVINKGVPAMTTTELSRNLESDVDREKPDMIIFLIGINDVFFKDQVAVTKFSKFKLLVLEKFKIYRLAKNLTKGAFAYIRDKYINKNYVLPGKNLLADNGQSEQSLDGDVLRHDDWVFENFLVASEEMERLKNISVPKPPYYEDVTNYHPLSIRNFNVMANAMYQRGVQVVIMQYPLLSIDPLKDAIWENNNILFVENQWLFKKVVLKEGLAAYFDDDYGHVNQKGRWLMASNLADKILRYLEKE